jgi:GT2 family glycosyltransferase
MNYSHTVVICTKDRIAEVFGFLENLSTTSSFELVRVIIVENSLSKANIQSLNQLITNSPKFNNVTVLDSLPGLARARNESFSFLNSEIVHFMDDDIYLPTDYFEVVDRAFFENQDIGGLAPYIQNLPLASKKFNIISVRKVFQKFLNTEGKLLKSGRAIWFSGNGSNAQVTWLPGCCMVYRLEVIQGFRFEIGLENGPLGGYALGEDLDFSHRVSKISKLLHLGELSIIHKLAPNSRTDWIKMDEGIGRLRAYLLTRFPQDLSFSRVMFSLVAEGIMDIIRIHVTKKKSVSKGYLHFSRLRAFILERQEQKLFSPKVDNEN